MQFCCKHVVLLGNSGKSWAELGFLRVKNKNLDAGGLAGVKYLQQKANGSGLAAACIWHQVTL